MDRSNEGLIMSDKADNPEDDDALLIDTSGDELNEPSGSKEKEVPTLAVDDERIKPERFRTVKPVFYDVNGVQPRFSTVSLNATPPSFLDGNPRNSRHPNVVNGNRRRLLRLINLTSTPIMDFEHNPMYRDFHQVRWIATGIASGYRSLTWRTSSG